MKRVGGLYPHIGGWDILREAFRRAHKGARQAGAAAASRSAAWSAST